MSRIVKSLLVTVVAGVLVFGAVFGLAASLGISGVDNLGSEVQVVGSPPDVIDVSWSIDASDYTKVADVEIGFNSALSAGSKVYVSVQESDGTELTKGRDESASGSVVTIDLDSAVAAKDVGKIVITVLDH
jgi:hypothetical protein